MSLIDRVKERVETDFSDTELQAFIDEALADIRDRYGADADSDSPITRTLIGDKTSLDLKRPLDASETIVVTEYVGTVTTVLAADDYRIWYNGRTIQRLNDGTNARTKWGDRADITYTPLDDTKQREEVVIKVMQLSVEYEGVSSRKVGDVATSHADYTAERERLITSLSPRKGLLMA